jgi:hypothetical protein
VNKKGRGGTKKDKENLCAKRVYLARAIARISLLVPPRHSLLQNRGKITPFRPFYLEKCQKNDRKLIEKGRKSLQLSAKTRAFFKI